MTELTLLLIALTAGSIGYFANRFVELQRNEVRREEGKKRIQIIIDAAKDLRGGIERMKKAIPENQIGATLKHAELADLAAIVTAIKVAETELNALKLTYGPQLNAAAEEVGLTLQPAQQQQKQNNQQQQQRQN